MNVIQIENKLNPHVIYKTYACIILTYKLYLLWCTIIKVVTYNKQSFGWLMYLLNISSSNQSIASTKTVKNLLWTLFLRTDFSFCLYKTFPFAFTIFGPLVLYPDKLRSAFTYLNFFLFCIKTPSPYFLGVRLLILTICPPFHIVLVHQLLVLVLY